MTPAAAAVVVIVVTVLTYGALSALAVAENGLLQAREREEPQQERQPELE